MANVVKKNQMADIPTKNGSKYSYQYVDIAQIHEFLDSIGARYIQQIKRIENDDYVMTKRCFNGAWEDEWLQGSKVVDATLFGNDNPAQKQGSALTYARRYSLLMAFGLATEDDDANSLNNFKEPTEEDAKAWKFSNGKHAGKTLEQVLENDAQYVEWYLNNKNDNYMKKCYEIITGQILPTEKEKDERIGLIQEINALERNTNTDHEEILGYFKVGSFNEMTNAQLSECKKILEKKMK